MLIFNEIGKSNRRLAQDTTGGKALFKAQPFDLFTKTNLSEVQKPLDI
jgi:hypothetical protein